MQLTWHEGELLEDYPALEVTVFAITPDKNVVLVRRSGEEGFRLPGGAVAGREAPDQAALRVLKEQTQLESNKAIPLGSLEIEDPTADSVLKQHFQQAVYTCMIQTYDESWFEEKRANREECIMVELKHLTHYAPWLCEADRQQAYHSLLTYVVNLDNTANA